MKKIKILLELRPALDGFAGIPQEVRLLFRGIKTIDSIDIEGMIQSGGRSLAKGASSAKWLAKATPAQRYERYSNVIISMTDKPYRSFINKFMSGLSFIHQLAMLTGIGKIRLSLFESEMFKDFSWRTLFSKTLPASDYALVSGANHRVNPVPHGRMHRIGLMSLNWKKSPTYLKLDTRDFDIFIGQTPYPAKISEGTKMVIRYHDAFPVFMPYTIAEKSIHQASHFNALSSNVKSGAWFSCVSETTRQDLLRIFPEVADRSVVIYNMVSHDYFRMESSFDLIPGIIQARYYDNQALAPKFSTLLEGENFFNSHLPRQKNRYLLIVSTIEPRKNHLRLLAAWETLKAETDPDLKLIVVGSLGWGYADILKGFRTWINRGELFPLNDVPAADLRVLYQHAAATICPSLGEGFDFSGVESMACGGVTVASDIAVHREVYEDAAEYFDPYSTGDLVRALKKVLYAPDAESVKKRMVQRGEVIVARYRPEKILPQWNTFINRLMNHDFENSKDLI